ncbi:MAG: tRNA (adenosine(37)-N6)-threonylcarbamoyltransferase complex dimerization subunit type 1 TsaB [Bacteroidota bacterium]
MPDILLLESATEVCSVAVFSENRIIALSENQHCTNHAAELTLLVSDCMKKASLNFADLDAVAVSGGPGAYTSLRVGASVAKGLCYALDKPLVVFDTLLALAAAARKMTDTRKLLLLPALDARRQEVWMALYDENLKLLLPARPFILDEGSVWDYCASLVPDACERQLIVVGNGSPKIKGQHFEGNPEFPEMIRCSAAHAGEIALNCFLAGEFQDVAYYEPFYMKPPNITISKQVPFQ